MANSQFRFKQFSIDQDRCAMKVGTDGVLLGAWADIETAHRILDIGTGTGLIALMAAQRNDRAEIHAIEIDSSSAQQAVENIAASPFDQRVSLEQIALQDYSPDLKFDAIICNPPFFKAGTVSPIPERQQARHSISLSIVELLFHSGRLASTESHLHLVLPLDREGDMMANCEAHGWYLDRITVVHPNPTRPPKRILVSCSRKPSRLAKTTLTIEKDQRFDYTQEYIGLTSPFYPKMTNARNEKGPSLSR